MANNGVNFHLFTDYPMGTTLPGIIVPQQVYVSTAQFQPQPPIRFFRTNGQLGISLRDAVNQSLRDLHDSQSTPSVTSTSTRIAMRILWPGYEAWGDTVHVYDHTASIRSYTLAKLAHTTAKTVRKFMNDMSTAPSTEPSRDWWVTSVSFDSLYLVELRHVSSGSWQPVLCRAVQLPH